jgi:hypothetical protein
MGKKKAATLSATVRKTKTTTISSSKSRRQPATLASKSQIRGSRKRPAVSENSSSSSEEETRQTRKRSRQGHDDSDCDMEGAEDSRNVEVYEMLAEAEVEMEEVNLDVGESDDVSCRTCIRKGEAYNYTGAC